MSSSAHEAIFKQSIPRYVNHAHEVVDAIIEKALEEPESGIQLSAFQIGRIGVFANIEDLREFWQERDDWAGSRWAFNVDVPNIPSTNQHLALQRDYWRRSVWTYDPTRTSHEYVGDTEARWTASDWMANIKVRSDPQGLVTPTFSFLRDEERNPMEQIAVALCSQYSSGLELGVKRDILEIDAEAYRNSPHLYDDEARLLEQTNVYALHTMKLNDILRIMETVAP